MVVLGWLRSQKKNFIRLTFSFARVPLVLKMNEVLNNSNKRSNNYYFFVFIIWDWRVRSEIEFL